MVSVPAAPGWRRAQCLLETGQRAEGGAEGSSDPGKSLGLQDRDPVSQTHLGKDHQEDHSGSKDHSQKPGVREKPQAIHRNCQSPSDNNLIFPSCPKESPSDFQFLKHRITM